MLRMMVPLLHAPFRTIERIAGESVGATTEPVAVTGAR